jgi:plasmid maintenance system antidote protein VapI
MQVAQGQPSAQRPLPILAVQPKPSKIDDALLRTCSSFLEAIHLCIHLSRLPHYAIAERLGVDRGHWTRMMQGQAHFPTNKLTALMDYCGNYAPMQWLAAQTGFELFEDAKQKRKEELRRELEQLEAA